MLEADRLSLLVLVKLLRKRDYTRFIQMNCFILAWKIVNYLLQLQDTNSVT